MYYSKYPQYDSMIEPMTTMYFGNKREFWSTRPASKFECNSPLRQIWDSALFPSICPLALSLFAALVKLGTNKWMKWMLWSAWQCGNPNMGSTPTKRTKEKSCTKVWARMSLTSRDKDWGNEAASKEVGNLHKMLHCQLWPRPKLLWAISNQICQTYPSKKPRKHIWKQGSQRIDTNCAGSTPCCMESSVEKTQHNGKEI